MLSHLGQHANRRIIVSLPALLGSPDPLTCVLVSSEIAGIWILSPELAEKLYPIDLAGHTPPPIFVPFTQIGFIVSAELQQPPPPSESPASPEAHEPSKSRGSHRK